MKNAWVSIVIGLGVWSLNNVAYAGVIGDTFNKGGAGFAIVQLLVIAAFGCLAYYIASALNSGQIANMIKLVTTFSCIAVVIGVIWNAISTVAKLFNVTL